MNNVSFHSLFNSWASKEPLEFHFEGSPPVIGVIVAFGKTGLINHFDTISVIEVSCLKEFHSLEWHSNKQNEKLYEFELKQISFISPPRYNEEP